MATHDHPRVWAIVLHYRLWRETVACVRSLLESDYTALHILVVDNGSADAATEALRAGLDERVHWLGLPQNRFYAGGMNAGLAWALERDAEWLLAMNNDTLVAPDMVGRLVQAACAQPGVGIVAPLIYYAAEPERVWSAGARRRRLWPFARELARDGRLPGDPGAPLFVDYVTGCAMLLARETLERVGLFDLRYRMYYEDVDLCERVRRAGYRILVEPRARMWHLVARTAGEEPALNRYHRTRNRWRYYMEHTRGLARAAAAAVLLCQETWQGLRDVTGGRAALARARCRGFWHFLSRKGL